MEITGRLTADAVTRTVRGDKVVVGFRLAINDSYVSNNERVEVTNFVDCSYWLGKGIAPYMKKGGVVQACGRIGVNAWISNDGEAVGRMTMHVSEIKLFSAPAAKNVSVPLMEDTGRPETEGENGDLPF